MAYLGRRMPPHEKLGGICTDSSKELIQVQSRSGQAHDKSIIASCAIELPTMVYAVKVVLGIVPEEW